MTYTINPNEWSLEYAPDAYVYQDENLQMQVILEKDDTTFRGEVWVLKAESVTLFGDSEFWYDALSSKPYMGPILTKAAKSWFFDEGNEEDDGTLLPIELPEWLIKEMQYQQDYETDVDSLAWAFMQDGETHDSYGSWEELRDAIWAFHARTTPNGGQYSDKADDAVYLMEQYGYANPHYSGHDATYYVDKQLAAS